MFSVYEMLEIVQIHKQKKNLRPKYFLFVFWKNIFTKAAINCTET